MRPEIPPVAPHVAIDNRLTATEDLRAQIRRIAAER
jgi:hypothetical protein